VWFLVKVINGNVLYGSRRKWETRHIHILGHFSSADIWSQLQESMVVAYKRSEGERRQ